MVALEPSLFSINMRKLIGDTSSGTDVTFIFPDKSTMEVHRLVLCCTSTLFRRIFLSNTAITNLIAANPEAKIGGKLTSKDINNGRVTGLVLVSTDRDIPYDCVHFEESQTILLTLSDDVSKSALSEVLNFMYTGKLHLSTAAEDKHSMAVLDLARTFQIDILTEFFKDDLEMSEQDLREQWKAEFVSFNNELFCNTSRFSDVSFRVEEQLVRAHLCVLVAHCDFMAAMLSGNFQESGQKEVGVYNYAYYIVDNKIRKTHSEVFFPCIFTNEDVAHVTNNFVFSIWRYLLELRTNFYLTEKTTCLCVEKMEGLVVNHQKHAL